MTSESVAVVTGGTRGIGRSCLDALKADGFIPFVVDIDSDAIERLQVESDIAGLQLDVSNYDEVCDVFARIEDQIGPITVLVNNAGITRDSMIHKMDPIEQWKTVVDVNLTGVFNTCRVAIPTMRERKSGRIINISSANGQRGQAGQSNYAAAKAGVLGLTRSIAQEVGRRGITANAICPGYVMTDMTAGLAPEFIASEVERIPVGRMAETKDISYVVSFLASEKASYINGATMSVNGGVYITA